MPCTYTGSLDGDAKMAAEAELNKLSNYLCWTLTLLMDQWGAMPQDYKDCPIGLVEWWTNHLKIDEEKKMKIKNSLIAKLKKDFTPEEIELLGIKV